MLFNSNVLRYNIMLKHHAAGSMVQLIFNSFSFRFLNYCFLIGFDFQLRMMHQTYPTHKFNWVYEYSQYILMQRILEINLWNYYSVSLSNNSQLWMDILQIKLPKAMALHQWLFLLLPWLLFEYTFVGYIRLIIDIWSYIRLVLYACCTEVSRTYIRK